jgi:hypothetical protein
MTGVFFYFAILFTSVDSFRSVLRKATVKADKILRNNLLRRGKDVMLNSSHVQAFGNRILLGVVDSVAGDITRANLPDSAVDWGIDEVVNYVPHAVAERVLFNSNVSFESSETNLTLSAFPMQNGTAVTVTHQNSSADEEVSHGRSGTAGAAIRGVVSSLLLQYIPYRIPQLIAQFLHDHIHLLQFGMPHTH